jgi:hypothetical protein
VSAQAVHPSDYTRFLRPNPKERGVHVHLAAGMRWAVRRRRSARAIRLFDHKPQAVEFAKQIAAKDRCALYIHREDGMVEYKVTFK